MHLSRLWTDTQWSQTSKMWVIWIEWEGRQSTCHVFGQIHCANKSERLSRNRSKVKERIHESEKTVPQLSKQSTCHVFGQIHCAIKSEKLSRNRSKVKERIHERWKNCTLVEQCRDKTVTCHVFGQTHCVNAAKIEEEKQCTCHVFGQTHSKRLNH